MVVDETLDAYALKNPFTTQPDPEKDLDPPPRLESTRLKFEDQEDGNRNTSEPSNQASRTGVVAGDVVRGPQITVSTQRIPKLPISEIQDGEVEKARKKQKTIGCHRQ